MLKENRKTTVESKSWHIDLEVVINQIDIGIEPKEGG